MKLRSPKSDIQSSTRHAARGWLWGGADQFIHRGLGMAVSLVLARLLEPAAFGLIASVAIFLTVAQKFIDAGIGQRILQKKQIVDEDYEALFWATGLVALLCSGLLAALSSPIASFYGSPQLRQIVIALAVVMWLMSLGRVPYAILNRQMRFRAISLISMTSVTAGCGTGLWMAFQGFGVWSLIGQQTVHALVRATCLWVWVPWRPRFRISIASVTDLYRFGTPILFSQIVRSIADQLINVLIVRRVSATELGLFDRGRVIPLNINVSLELVTTRANLTVLAKLQENPVAFRETYLRTLGSLFTAYLLLMSGLALASEEIVIFLLGHQWQPSGWYLQMSCVALSFQAFIICNAQAIKAQGNSTCYLTCALIAAGLQILGVSVGSIWGAHGMVRGDLIARAIACIPFVIALRNVSSVLPMQQIRALGGPLLGVSVMTIAWHVLSAISLPQWLRVAGLSLVGLGVFAILILRYNERPVDPSSTPHEINGNSKTHD